MASLICLSHQTPNRAPLHFIMSCSLSREESRNTHCGIANISPVGSIDFNVRAGMRSKYLLNILKSVSCLLTHMRKSNSLDVPFQHLSFKTLLNKSERVFNNRLDGDSDAFLMQFLLRSIAVIQYSCSKTQGAPHITQRELRSTQRHHLLKSYPSPQEEVMLLIEILPVSRGEDQKLARLWCVCLTRYLLNIWSANHPR